MSNKKYFPGKKYLKYFRRNLAGQFEYCGDYYQLTDNKMPVNSLKLILRLLSYLSIIAPIISGCIPTAGAVNIYVVIPMVLEVVFGVIYALVLSRFLSEDVPIREYIWKGTIKKLPVLCTILLIVSVAALITETIYIFNNGFESKEIMTYLYLALKLSNIVSSALSLVLVVRMKWEKVD